MKLFTAMVTLVLFFTWMLNASAAELNQEKMEKKEKKIRVQKLEKKAGLGVVVSNVEDKDRAMGLKSALKKKGFSVDIEKDGSKFKVIANK